jgi:hypothetical protein
MNPNKWKAVGVAILGLATILLVPIKATAQNQDCQNTLNKATAACNANQTKSDTIAYNLWQTNLLIDSINEVIAVKNDATTQAAAKAVCDTTLAGYLGVTGQSVGSCAQTKTLQDSSNATVYAQAQFNCLSSKSPTPQVCDCLADATYNFNIAQDQAAMVKCQSDAQNTHDDSCVPASQAIQAQADSLAQAAQGLADAKVTATYAQTTTLEDSYQTPLCKSAANTADANCELAADCASNPPPAINCCLDTAAENYNTAVQAAYAAFVAVVGPADAQYHHDNPMCSAVQADGDAIANALYTFTQANAQNTENTTIALAGDTKTQATATANNQYEENQAVCQCNNPTQQGTGYDKCISAAQLLQQASLNTANTAYALVANPNNPLGSAIVSFNTAVANALTALNATKAKDHTTQVSCSLSAILTFSNINNTQTAIYNIAENDAYWAYCDAYNACFGS